MKSYLRSEIAKIVGTTGKLIRDYTELGLVIPEVEHTTGKGTKRRYSLMNVFECILIRELVRYCVRLQDMHAILKKTSQHWPQIWDVKRSMPSHKRYFLVIPVHEDMTPSECEIYPQQKLINQGDNEIYLMPVQLIRNEKICQPQTGAIVIDLNVLAERLIGVQK